MIELADLGGENGLRRLLTQYYQDITQTIPRLRLGAGPRKSSGPLNLLRRLLPVHFPRTAVHHLCEDRLITAGGNRNTRHEDEIIHEIGVAKADLEHLVDSRLLRREPRLNEAFYELSHDSLVPSLQTTGTWRKRLSMTINVFFSIILIIIIVFWGIPYSQSAYTIYSLNQKLKALKNNELSILKFQNELNLAKKIIKAPGQLIFYRDELQTLFNHFQSPKLIYADSVLGVIRQNYPLENGLINELADLLKSRKIQEVIQQYNQFLRFSGFIQDTNQVNTNNLKPVFDPKRISAFLDSAYIALDKNNRILELQTDLAIKMKDDSTATRLKDELKRQKALYTKQIQAAIQLKEPKSLRIKASNLLQVILKNHPLLARSRIYLNNQEMNFEKIGSERFRIARIKIPPKTHQLSVTFKVLDPEKNEATKDVTFLIADVEKLLRSMPIDTLSYANVVKMLAENGFYDRTWNPNGKGFANDFESILNGQVILDHVTGLMWQQAGSSEYMTRENANKYVEARNKEKLAGFSDWRLPTLEEAMSLMEPKENEHDLFIDPLFDTQQSWIWTADGVSGGSLRWVVNFNHGDCGGFNIHVNSYVRLVRSGH